MAACAVDNDHIRDHSGYAAKDRLDEVSLSAWRSHHQGYDVEPDTFSNFFVIIRDCARGAGRKLEFGDGARMARVDPGCAQQRRRLIQLTFHHITIILRLKV